MTKITRLSSIVGTAMGTALLAQSAFAGPGCYHSGMYTRGFSSGYSPAVYQAGTSNYAPVRAYKTGMGYGNKSKSRAQGDIVDTAVAAGSFNTLVAAVKAAGLVDTLKGDGPFTVFAPTDDAFAKLPKEKLDALLRDKAALTKVLTYHVVSGKVKAADVVTMNSVGTVEGQSLKIKAGDAAMINNAKVIKTDIATSNGIIHVIDSVMLPPDMISQR